MSTEKMSPNETDRHYETESTKDPYQVISTINYFYENLQKHYQNEKIASLRETIESLYEYKQYKRQKVRFTYFENFVNRAREIAEQEQDQKKRDEKMKLVDKLTKRLKELRQSIGEYYLSICRLENMRRPAVRLRMHDEDYKERLSEMDKSRRIHHNAMMSALAIFVRFSNKDIYKALGIRLDRDKLFDDFNDRTAIGEWAFITELGLRFEAIIKASEETQTNNRN